MLTGPLHTPLPLRRCPLLVFKNFSPKSQLLTYFCGGAEMIYGACCFGEQGELSGGGCGDFTVAYFCVCSGSCLLPLWLCAAFVFADENINHPKVQQDINNNQNLTMKKKEKRSKDFIHLLNLEVHSGSESQLTICSPTRMCEC